MSARAQKAVLIVTMVVVWMAVLLPTSILVSSWHVWWGLFITVPDALLGFWLGGLAAEQLLAKLLMWKRRRSGSFNP